MYKHVAKTWKNIFKDNYRPLRIRAVSWRKQTTIKRLEYPSSLTRARSLGYKSKQGIIVVRTKIRRGGMRRQRPRAGRRQKHLGVLKMKAKINAKEIAENRVQRKYPNLKVLNSYLVYKDGRHSWFEVILLDIHHPSIQSDHDFKYHIKK